MYITTAQFSQFGHSVVSASLWLHELQDTRPPCPSPAPRGYSNSCSLSQWCHPTISSSVVPFPSCLQSFPASGSFPVSQFFTSGGQLLGVSPSASVLPVNIHNNCYSVLKFFNQSYTFITLFLYIHINMYIFTYMCMYVYTLYSIMCIIHYTYMYIDTYIQVCIYLYICIYLYV